MLTTARTFPTRSLFHRDINIVSFQILLRYEISRVGRANFLLQTITVTPLSSQSKNEYCTGRTACVSTINTCFRETYRDAEKSRRVESCYETMEFKSSILRARSNDEPPVSIKSVSYLTHFLFLSSFSFFPLVLMPLNKYCHGVLLPVTCSRIHSPWNCNFIFLVPALLIDKGKQLAMR